MLTPLPLGEADAKRRVRAGFAAQTTRERFGHTINVRDDNPRVASQVEDWFFVPEKHFFSVPQIRRLFEERELSFELVYPQTGRFKSSSNFVARGGETLS